MAVQKSDKSGEDPFWLTRRDNRQRTHERRQPSPREQSREELLSDWFGEAAAPLEMLEHQQRYSSMREGVDEAMTAIGRGYSVLLNQLREQWPKLVGPGIAANSRPLSLHEAVLNVETASSTWLHVLRTEHREAILEAVARFAGDRVRDIHFIPAGRQQEERPPSRSQARRRPPFRGP